MNGAFRANDSISHLKEKQTLFLARAGLCWYNTMETEILFRKE